MMCNTNVLTEVCAVWVMVIFTQREIFSWKIYTDQWSPTHNHCRCQCTQCKKPIHVDKNMYACTYVHIHMETQCYPEHDKQAHIRICIHKCVIAENANFIYMGYKCRDAGV